MSDDQDQSKAPAISESGEDPKTTASSSAADADAPERVFGPEAEEPSAALGQYGQSSTELVHPSRPPASDPTQPPDLAHTSPAGPSSGEATASNERLFREPTHEVTPEDVVDLLSIDWEEGIADFEDPTSEALAQAFAKAPQRVVFSGFDTGSDGQRAPFAATLTQAQLLLIDNLLLAVYDDPRKHPSLARIVVFSDGLLIQANSVIALLQHRVQLDQPTGLPGDARATFYVSAVDLHQAMKPCGGVATLAWQAGEALVFASGAFERDIGLRPAVQFHKLSEPTVQELSLVSVGGVPIEALSDALKHTWPLVEGFSKRSFEAAIITSTGDGALSVGRPGAMAEISSASMKAFVYSIRGKQASSLKTALTALQHPIELFHDSRHYILWDGITAIGFDRDSSSLQQAREKWGSAEWTPEILIPRKQLTHSIHHVAALSGADNFELQIKGAGKIAITVSAASGPRKRARSALDGVSQSILPITRLTLPVWPTLAALGASDTVNTCLRVSSLGLMVDDSDGRPSGRHFIHGQKASSAK